MSNETNRYLIHGISSEQDLQPEDKDLPGKDVFDSLSDLEKRIPFIDVDEAMNMSVVEMEKLECVHDTTMPLMLAEQRKERDDAKCNGIISFGALALTLTLTCWLTHGILAARIEEGSMGVEELFWWVVTTMRVTILSVVVVLVAAVIDWTLNLDCMEPLT